MQVWATMRSTSAWDIAPKDNIIVAALDVTSEESVDKLVKEIIEREGDAKILSIESAIRSHVFKLQNF